MSISPIGWVVYTDDQGNNVNIKMSHANANAQGATWGTAPNSAYPFWPFGHRNLRHVTGKASTGQRGVLIITSISNGLYQLSTTSWTGNSYTYNVESAIGERKPANHVS